MLIAKVRFGAKYTERALGMSKAYVCGLLKFGRTRNGATTSAVENIISKPFQVFP
jgi:hypothetical protein